MRPRPVLIARFLPDQPEQTMLSGDSFPLLLLPLLTHSLHEYDADRVPPLNEARIPVTLAIYLSPNPNDVLEQSLGR